LKYWLALAMLAGSSAIARTPDGLKPYVREDAGALVLEHVRVIDGTGAAAAEDQRIDIEGGKITRVESAQQRHRYPTGAKVLDLTGKTVMPGLVGMHEHLFYPTPKGGSDGLPMCGEMADSAPRLYLAAGVTTARTAGSMEPYVDLALKRMIDAGQRPGPKLHVTAPYIGDLAGFIPQFHTLTGAEDAGRMVDYWAEEGATSFKAFMSIKRNELKTAIEHAHARGLKVTGHLCAVGFREAAALGIDNLEHGIIVHTEFFPGKKPDECTAQEAADDFAKRVEIDSAPVQEMIRELVARHVAVTSTLGVGPAKSRFGAVILAQPPASSTVALMAAVRIEPFLIVGPPEIALGLIAGAVRPSRRSRRTGATSSTVTFRSCARTSFLGFQVTEGKEAPSREVSRRLKAICSAMAAGKAKLAPFRGASGRSDFHSTSLSQT
jgi:imidazolonepropionase-like amidohydrolase